jgi:hypothetical protein
MADIWHKVDTRRQFFIDYAKNIGFDPLLPENWYTQPLNKILATQVFPSLSLLSLFLSLSLSLSPSLIIITFAGH